MRPSVSAPSALVASLALLVACGGDAPPSTGAGPGTTLRLLAREPETRIEQPAAVLPVGDIAGMGSFGISDGGGWARTLDPDRGQAVHTKAPQARLILPTTHAAARTITLQLCRVCTAEEAEASAETLVRLRLNGTELVPEGLRVGCEPRPVTVESPEPAWMSGPQCTENVLELAVEERVVDGRKAWDVLALAGLTYGPPEQVTLSPQDGTARLAPRTGLRYSIELGRDAELLVEGTTPGAGTLAVRLGLLDPRTGDQSQDPGPAVRLEARDGRLSGRVPIPRRTGAVRMLEVVWESSDAAELSLTRLDVHEPGSAPRPPIVFVSIDTFAARHLSLYGYVRRTSPALEELQRDAVVFERCLANAPWTLPSYLSVMSGLYPRAHDVSPPHQAATRPDLFDTLYLAPNRWTLAEALRARGYRTGGFVDTYWLSPLYGVRQGFDHYDGQAAMAEMSDPHAGIELIVKRLVPPWLDGAGPELPPFLFVHALDAHGPYLPETPFLDTFLSGLGPERTPVPADSLNQTYRAVPHWMALTLQPDETRPMPSTMPNEELVARYDEALLKVDSFLGQLFAELKARGLYDQAVIVVTGDHGEAFGPGVWGHGIMREAVLHVPLVVKLPANARGGTRVTRPVSLVDLYPTLLELAGVPPEPSRLHGTSLLQFLGPGASPERALYGEAGWVEQYAVTAANWRLVEERPGSESADYSLLTHPRVPEEWLRAHFPEVLARPLTQQLADELRQRPGYAERIAELRRLVAGPYFSLYDLRTDPEGVHDVSAEHPEVMADLKARLATERARSRAARAEARPGALTPTLDPAQKEALGALGYGGD